VASHESPSALVLYLPTYVTCLFYWGHIIFLTEKPPYIEYCWRFCSILYLPSVRTGSLEWASYLIRLFRRVVVVCWGKHSLLLLLGLYN